MFPIVTPFPFLLDFSFYAPLLLRLALGVYVLAIGFSAQHKNVTVVASENTVVETKPEISPLHFIYRALFIIAGISLIVGIYVQVSAILLALLMLVSIVHAPARLTNELNRAELSLLLIISLSLLLTGAGPLAFDLPL